MGWQMDSNKAYILNRNPTFRRYDDGSYVFQPCSQNDHEMCVGVTNNLHRDGRTVKCDCACHATTEANDE